MDDAEVTIDVEAEGAEEAQAEIEATGLVAAEVDGQLVIIDVEAQGAEEASEQLQAVGESSDDAAVGAAAAGGALGDLSGEASGAATSLLASAAALAGVSLGLSELFSSALDATSAQQSFEARTGEAADAVERLSGASSVLGDTQGELAIALGSSDEELRNATARLFALGEAEGFTSERSDALIEQVVDLAARARVLNPELGSVGDITDTLGTRLQRGGRFVADFGLSLTAADIQARALQNTGKDLTSELTLLEKTEAAAQLATEQLGDSLGTDLANAENAAITFDSLKTSIEEALEPLGAPLISPVLQLIEAMGPIIEDVASVLADLGVIALDALLPIVEAAAPLVDVWRENAEEILASLAPALTELGEALATLLTALGPSFEDVLGVIVEAAPAIADVLGVLADVIVLLAAGVTAVSEFTEALDNLVSKIPGLGGLVDSLNPLNRVLPQTTSRAVDMGDAFEEAARQQIVAGLAAGDFTQEELHAAGAAIEAAEGTLRWADVLIALESGAFDATEATKGLNAEVTESERLSKVSAESFVLLADAIAAGVVTTEDYQAVADQLGLSLDQVTAFAESVTDQLDEFAANAIEKLPQVGTAVDQLEAEFQASPDAIIASLAESEEAIANFQTNVAALIAFGFDDIAQLALERGPEFTNELVNTLRVGREGLATELETSLETYEQQLTATGDFIRDTAAPALVTDTELAAQGVSEAFGRELDLGGATAQSVAAAKENLDLAAPELRASGETAGAEADDAYGTALDLEGATAESADQAALFFESLGIPGGTLSQAAEDAGDLIGNSFAIGIGNAMTAAAGDGGFLNLQFRSAVDDLERAMREEAEANSPSKLFARIGEDLMEGLAQGVDVIGLPDFGLGRLAATAAAGTGTSGAGMVNTLTVEAGAVVVNISGVSGDPAAIAAEATEQVTEALPLAASRAMLHVEVMAQ